MDSIELTSGSQKTTPIKRKDLTEKYREIMLLGFTVSLAIGFAAVVLSLYCMSNLIVPTLIVSEKLMIPAIVLLMIGFLFPFFTFVGWRGAVNYNTLDLHMCRCGMIFFVIMTTMLGIYVCVITYIYPGTARGLYKAIVFYQEDSGLASRIDIIQRDFYCCGIKSINDWNKNEYFTCEDENPDENRCDVPTSCCITDEHKETPAYCAEGALNMSKFQNYRREQVLYTEGCATKLDNYLFIIVVDLAILVFFLAICQGLVGKLASVLIRVINERNARKNARAKNSAHDNDDDEDEDGNEEKNAINDLDNEEDNDTEDDNDKKDANEDNNINDNEDNNINDNEDNNHGDNDISQRHVPYDYISGNEDSMKERTV